MKTISSLLAITLIAMSCNSSSKNSTDKPIEVIITVTTTGDYCGGAHPNDKILKQLQTPSTYSNKDILISTNNKLNDSMTSLSANEKGVITTSLTPSTYYVYLPEKPYTNFTAGGDEAACKKWKNTPNATFNVEAETQEITLNVHKTCSPCGAKRM